MTKPTKITTMHSHCHRRPLPFAKNKTESTIQKTSISLISLVPQLVIFIVIGLLLYLKMRAPLFSTSLDVLMWISLLVLTFLVNLASMYIPWTRLKKDDIDHDKEE